MELVSVLFEGKKFPALIEFVSLFPAKHGCKQPKLDRANHPAKKGPIMCHCLMKPFGRPLCSAALLLFLLSAGDLRAQGSLSNSNGVSSIWELLYGASGLDPDADTDGDGVPNRLESVAGTNPFDANSFPRITSSTYLGANFSVSVPCVPGKFYQLQSSSTLHSGSWSNESGVIAGTGAVVTLTAPIAGVEKFLRVVISDVDSDDDGLTDWEEMQLGLDPARASSNGQLDGNGQ